MATWQLVYWLMLSCLPNQVFTLYNKIMLYEKRCFTEDVPDNTMISFKWALHHYSTQGFDKDPTPEGNMRLTITSAHSLKHSGGDTGILRHEQQLTGGFGTVKYFASDSGEYLWCFEMQPAANGAQMGTFHMEPSIEYSDDEVEVYNEIVATQDAIIRTLGNIMRRARQIKSEQSYYKKREQEFRELSYLTSTRVIWYGALTALTVITTGCFLMMNMKSFFLAKKLV
ncbi:transmembrane emp24 domain-containing protein eca-like [Bolinopsis microptera]|uniref:transmembrane emp24 domain-containing protein eca-like n=1 Tax=Bolinopsis microptera TaxID=2820187 RepID=UPI00307B0761